MLIKLETLNDSDATDGYVIVDLIKEFSFAKDKFLFGQFDLIIIAVATSNVAASFRDLDYIANGKR